MKTIWYSKSAYRLKLLWLSALLIVGFFATGSMASSSNIKDHAVKLREEFVSARLNKHMKVYPVREDISVPTFLDKIQSQELKERKPAYDEYIWLMFYIKNTGANPIDLLLEVNNLHINHYELYRVDPEKSKIDLVGTNGDTYPFYNRKIINRRFLEEFSQDGDSEIRYLIKIDDRDRVTSIAFELWNQPNFYERESKDNLFYNLYFGGLLFIGLFSLVIGVILNMKVFYTYGIYALVMAIFMFDDLGFAYQYIYPNIPELKRFVNIFLINPILWSVIVFASSYFKIKENNIKVYRLVQGLYVLLTVGVLFWLITQASYPIHYYILANYIQIACTIVLLVVFMVTGFSYNKIKASFFTLAIGGLSFSGVLLALADADVLPMEWFLTNPLLLGSVFEFCIFSISLVYEVRTINETKNKLVSEKAAQQEKLLKAYVEGAEKERTRLAGELHDNIGSRLALLKNKLGNIMPEDKELLDDLGGLYKNVRSMSHELSPGDFNVIGFEEYLQIYLQKFKNTTGIDVKLYLNNIPRLNTNISVQLFRIVQEATQNVQKHARAKTVEVQIVGYERELVMTLDDDGRGFELNDKIKTISKGIANMRTRVESLGGKFDISSIPDKGAHILVNIPLTNNQKHII